MGLFKDNGTHVTVSEDLKIINEFHEIIKRDKGSEGDSQGRKKLRATREFAYIYHMNDYSSPYQRYSEKERLNRLRNDLRLGENWEPDEVIRAAEQKYIELNQTPAIQSLVEARQTLNTSADVNRRIRYQIEDITSNDDLTAERLLEVNELLGKTLENNKKIPQVLEKINNLEDQVKKEEQNSAGIRGGDQLGYFEDPE